MTDRSVDTNSLPCQHSYIAGAAWCGQPRDAEIHRATNQAMSHPYYRAEQPTVATLAEATGETGLPYPPGTDIVKQLEGGADLDPKHYRVACRLMRLAADEIERLRVYRNVRRGAQGRVDAGRARVCRGYGLLLWRTTEGGASWLIRP